MAEKHPRPWSTTYSPSIERWDLWDASHGFLGEVSDETVALSIVAPVNASLLAACKAALFKIETLVATEKKPVLAPYPRGGVDYVGCDPADCFEVQQLRLAISSAEAQS